MADPDAKKADEKKDDKQPEAKKPDRARDRLGRFIAANPTIISSLFLGVAGLVATSIWQYRQSETTAKQAAAQQEAAETAAANSWKIERTDILGKNVSVLASTDPATADQRYGVLLSLVRADIIDPELAVSYALELGRDNADSMVSVLSAVPHVDWARLARAYVLSCDERYGTSPGIDACSDKLAARSSALGALVSEVLPAAMAGAAPKGPLALLADEHQVHLDVQLLLGLYGHALTEMYDRRQFDDIEKFEKISPGAHLVAALTLGASRTGEFVPEDESTTLDKFHDAQTKWLSDYLVSKPCDAECRGRVVEVMLTQFLESSGDYDQVMQRLLTAPQSQAHVAVSRLHARLLWCQAADDDVEAFRDGVLVPALAGVLATPNRDAGVVDALTSLLALVPEPAADAEVKTTKPWAALAALLANDPKIEKLLEERRATVAKQRKAPPFALRQMNFCNTNPPPAP